MKKKKIIRNILFVMIFIFIFNICEYTAKAESKADSDKNIAILVDLTEERLYLINTQKNIILKKYSIASGRTETPSPIGTWKVIGMENKNENNSLI